MEDVALDLNALAPKPVVVEYKDKKISVQQPTVEQFTKLVDIGTQFDGKAEPDLKQLGPLLQQATQLIYECIPDLNGENLNYLQITALFRLLGELASPAGDKATAELAKRGITLKNQEGQSDPKDLTSPEPSPSS